MPRPDIDDTSKEKIYRELRRRIIVGHLPPGERLTMQELAEHYGISITPIRDALQMLGQDGLVSSNPVPVISSPA